MINLIIILIVKLLSAVLSPLTFYIILILLEIIKSIVIRSSIVISFGGLGFVYIYALPVYLLLAVPVSIIIDKINPKWKIPYYAIAGLFGGILVVLLFSVVGTNDFDFDIKMGVGYMIAGIAFYLSEMLLKKLLKI